MWQRAKVQEVLLELTDDARESRCAVSLMASRFLLAKHMEQPKKRRRYTSAHDSCDALGCIYTYQHIVAIST